MIGAILRAANWLDQWLATRFGQPYRVVLSIGLVAEIVQRLREFPHTIGSAGGIVRELFAILLFAALLLHQLAEFHERVVARRERKIARAGRGRPPPSR